MAVREPKLCLLGDSGVGKTTLAERLGASHAPRAEGLWIHRWHRPDTGIAHALWDLRGRSLLDSLGQSFLAHADGLALVADAARPESIALAIQAGCIATVLIGECPQILILNRFDEQPLPALTAIPASLRVHALSARSGEGVEAAFLELADAVEAHMQAQQNPKAQDASR